MRTEKIIVASLQEAVEELKRTYGDNAIVLSSRVVRRRRWRFLPFFKTTLLEVTVGIPENESDFQREFEEKLKVYEELERLRSTLSEVMKNVKVQEERDQPRQEEEEGFSLRAQRIISRMVYRGVRKDIAR
ncbi:MAG TPA: flagellar biosynthesis protein FlhF, partial [Aquifex aeolicus]|nr:flagellar biosynthesis protein FlhF [Aquifex aeolicus]